MATNEDIQESLSDALAHPDAALSNVKITPGEKSVSRHDPYNTVRAANIADKRASRTTAGRRVRTNLVDG